MGTVNYLFGVVLCGVYKFWLFSVQSGGTKSFLCKCSFIEIYNEQIYDLLDSVSTSLFLREDIKRGVFVEGAVEKYAASAAEAYQVTHMLTSNSCQKNT